MHHIEPFKAGEINHHTSRSHPSSAPRPLTAPVTPNLRTRVRGEVKEQQLAHRIRKVFPPLPLLLIPFPSSFPFLPPFSFLSFPSPPFLSLSFSFPNYRKKKKTPPSNSRLAKSNATDLLPTMPLPPAPSPPPSPPTSEQE